MGALFEYRKIKEEQNVSETLETSVHETAQAEETGSAAAETVAEKDSTGIDTVSEATEAAESDNAEEGVVDEPSTADSSVDGTDDETTEADNAEESELVKPDYEAIARSALISMASARAGVPENRVGYIAKLCDISDIDLGAPDAPDKVTAAIKQVLTDLPELRGATGSTGSVGAHPKKKDTVLSPFERGFKD